MLYIFGALPRHLPIRLSFVTAVIVPLLFLFSRGTLIWSLVALENLFSILEILLLDALVNRLQIRGREPVRRHLVDPRLNLPQPLLLERNISPHTLRIPLDARIALSDVVFEGRDAAKDLDQPLDQLIGFRLVLLLLLGLTAPQDLLRLLPRLRIFAVHDAATQVLALVVAAPEQALDQVEVLDDLRVAAVLALLLVQKRFLVGVEALLVQVAEPELERLFEPGEAAQRLVARGDLDVAELLLRVPVAPVAVGRRGAEFGGVHHLLLVDLSVLLVRVLFVFLRLLSRFLLGRSRRRRTSVFFLGGTAALEGVELAPVAALAVGFLCFLPLGFSAGAGLLRFEGLPTLSSASAARFLLGGPCAGFLAFFFSPPLVSSSGRFLLGDLRVGAGAGAEAFSLGASLGAPLEVVASPPLDTSESGMLLEPTVIRSFIMVLWGSSSDVDVDRVEYWCCWFGFSGNLRILILPVSGY
ncbi:hypothetical protein PG996_007923 [Apiospora saccharicola]|uniref:Uncharacterized protein n=1 Tax=Apiospora saccharicola TaxID=335842 RepID=A0ABR1UWG5_9PEZI